MYKLFFITFLLLSCSTPKELSAYEKHQVAYKEYTEKTDLTGTPYSQLLDMWDTVYMESMLEIEQSN